MHDFPLNTLSEADLDSMIASAGGRRAITSIAFRPPGSNADYILKENVVELKLFEEEGLKKSDRQQKVAELFAASQPNRPVVVIDADLLDGIPKRKYYNFVEGPIKSHVRKAAKQLTATASRSKISGARILLAINNGYMSLSHEEFSDRVVKCASNNTSRIDAVVTAGCYFHSDGLEYFLLAPFDYHQINATNVPSCEEALRTSWGKLVGDKLTATIRGDEKIERPKPPVQDIVFEVNKVRFVKPAPAIGGEASWYPLGRPRKPSNLDRCPPVARVFPSLSEKAWKRLVTFDADSSLLSNYAEYREFTRSSLNESHEPTQPIAQVDIDCDKFLTWLDARTPVCFRSLAEYAAVVFDNLVRDIILDCRLASDSKVRPARYVLLRVVKIGQDESLDLCSLYLASTMPGLEFVTPVVEHVNIVEEHGKALAAAYAIKNQASMVYYEVDKTYCWH